MAFWSLYEYVQQRGIEVIPNFHIDYTTAVAEIFEIRNIKNKTMIKGPYKTLYGNLNNILSWKHPVNKIACMFVYEKKNYKKTLLH